jgi:hypothetical protein
MEEKLIKNKSKHYFLLLKQHQLFVYNFYNWNIKNPDIWFFILKNRILGYIPKWIIKGYGNITAYRIAHPWKYIGIKFSIFSFMKLIGLGFLLPFYGAGKGIYYFSQFPIPTKELIYNFFAEGFTFKKLFLLGSTILTGYLLYNNLSNINGLTNQDIFKRQSDLDFNSKKLIKSKYNWASYEYKTKAYIENNNIEYKKSYLVKIQENWNKVNWSDLAHTKEELAKTNSALLKKIEEIAVKNLEIENLKARLFGVRCELGSKIIEIEKANSEMASKTLGYSNSKLELDKINLEKAKFEMVAKNLEYLNLEIEKAKSEIAAKDLELKRVKHENDQINLELNRCNSKINLMKSEIEKAKLGDLIETQGELKEVKASWDSFKGELALVKTELVETQIELQNYKVKYNNLIEGYAESITKKDLIQDEKENKYLEVIASQKEMLNEDKILIDNFKILVKEKETELNIAKSAIKKQLEEKLENKKS